MFSLTHQRDLCEITDQCSIYFLFSNLPHLMYCIFFVIYLSFLYCVYLYDNIDHLYYLYIHQLPTAALFCQMTEVK